LVVHRDPRGHARLRHRQPFSGVAAMMVKFLSPPPYPQKPPHPARLRLAALSRVVSLYGERQAFALGGGHSVPLVRHRLTSAGISPLPSRERADAEGGRVRGLLRESLPWEGYRHG